MKVTSESEVAQSCLTLSDPMDCGLPSSSVHGTFQAKVLGVDCHCLLRTQFILNTVKKYVDSERKDIARILRVYSLDINNSVCHLTEWQLERA